MLLKSKSVILSFFLLYTAQKTLTSFLRVEPQAFLIKKKLIKYDWFQSTSPSYILRKYNAFAWIDVIDTSALPSHQR